MKRRILSPAPRLPSAESSESNFKNSLNPCALTIDGAAPQVNQIAL